jgi:hypothetical protein
MNLKRNAICSIILSAAGFLTVAGPTYAQTFTYKQTDLYLGFKTADVIRSNQVVVNIGSATNYVNLPAGSSNLVSGFSASQLYPGSFGLNNLMWSVGGDVKNPGTPGYPVDTIWVTSPRSDPNVQTVPPYRWDQGTLSSVVILMDSILSGAAQISARMSAGSENTATFVQEPGPNTGTISQSQTYYDYVANQFGNGTYRDNWFDANFVPLNVENATPASFSNPVRSDLYEVRPDGFLDPHTGQTSGNAYFVGYFQFNTNGTMAFIRASVNQAPPAPNLTILRNGTNLNISFLSSSGATYTLYYSSDLTAPFANWTSMPGTLSGDGTTKSFTDTTANSTRYYRVTAQ